MQKKWISAGLMLLMAFSLNAEVKYRVIELADEDGFSEIHPQSISDSGQIVGSSSNGVDVMKPLVWFAHGLEVTTDKITANVVGDIDGAAHHNNDKGDIVGSTLDHQAAVWKPYTNQISIHPQNAVSSRAMMVNNQGTILVQAFDKKDQCETFLWKNGVSTTLPIACAHFPAINDKEYVVSVANQKNASGESVYKTQLRAPNGHVNVIHTSDVAGYRTFQINNENQVAECVLDLESASPVESWLLEENKKTKLGHFCASGINDSGKIVGFSGSSDYSNGIIYTDNQVFSLSELLQPESDWFISVAIDINNEGWIIGKGYRRSASSWALKPVLLIPEVY